MPETAGGGILMLLANNPYEQDLRVQYEATSLVQAGYRVAVICPVRAGQPLRETVNGVEVYRYKFSFIAKRQIGYLFEYGYTTLAALALSLRLVRRDGFDVIHTHNPPDTLAVVAAIHKLFGKRFVFDHHDLAPEMYDARFPGGGNRVVRGGLTLLEKFSCRLADHVIATNESYKAMEMERGKIPAEKITVVRNGPNLERMKPTTPDPALRTRAGTILGYLGIMGYQDGVDHLLRALNHLVYDLGKSDVLCVLIGEGDAGSDLRRLATELELDAHVWFTGRIPDDELVRYLCAADICIDPDPSSPFNDRSTMQKIMEYMALHKPVVAFDLPEHRVTAGDAAVYVRPNDDMELARAVASLMDDPDRRKAMGELGRHRVEEVLAWPHSVPHLLAAYRTVFSGMRRKSRSAR